MWEFPKIRGTLLWGPYNKDHPSIQGTISGSPIFGNSHVRVPFISGVWVCLGFGVQGLRFRFRLRVSSGVPPVRLPMRGPLKGLGFRV